MNVVFDTNVVLDVLLSREPWRTQAEPLWMAADAGRLQVYFLASSVTDVFYITRKVAGWSTARKALDECFARLHIIAVDEPLLVQAASLAMQDFEDALQVVAVAASNSVGIVTRDAIAASTWPVRVFSPQDLISMLGKHS